MFAVSAISLPASASPMGTDSTQPNACTESVISQIQNLGSTINQSKAVSLAEGYASFASILAASSQWSFYAISATWTFDSNCVVNLKSVQVVFSVTGGSASGTYPIASESPDLNQVIGTSIQNNTERYIGYNPNWSGYEFWASENPGSVPTYATDAAWYVPSASQPYSGACVSANCDVAAWTGLAHYPGGQYGTSKGIVQTGTDSRVNCSSGTCKTTGLAWWELYPSSPIDCNFNVNFGDSITADVTSEATTGGSATTYSILLIDNTSGLSCSEVKSDSAMGTPVYGDFIAEQATNTQTLAKFLTFSMIGWGIYYNGTSHNIYSDPWYEQDVMVGSCGQIEAEPGTVNAAGSFTETWQYSC